MNWIETSCCSLYQHTSPRTRIASLDQLLPPSIIAFHDDEILMKNLAPPPLHLIHIHILYGNKETEIKWVGYKFYLISITLYIYITKSSTVSMECTYIYTCNEKAKEEDEEKA